MLYTYAPSLVKCNLFGVELKGLTKDSFVRIERLSNQSEFRKAIDGTHTVFYDNNPTYRVTISIDQTSASNEFLHTIFKLQQRVNFNMKTPLTVTERSGNGGSEFSSFDTFFETEPELEFGADTLPRQWTFICHNASYSLRGTQDSGFIANALRATIRLIELSEAAGIDLSTFEDMIKIAVTEAEKKIREYI